MYNTDMNKRQEAAVRGWAKFTPEEKSERMRQVATKKHQKLTDEEKSAHGAMMAKVRWDKKRLLDEQNKNK